MSRLRWLFALVLALTLVAAACGDDDDDDASTGATGGTSVATDGGTTPAGTGVALVLGAPADCETNAFCLPGLESVYGVDLTPGFVALDGAPLVEALRAGEVDVANLFSTSPVISDEGWVLLEDDQGLLAADNIVPVLSDELVDAYGTDLIDVLNNISAALTTSDLTALNAQVDIDRADPAEAAGGWLDAAGLAGAPTDTPLAGPEIKIGAQDFTESLILAQIYQQALSAAGFNATIQEVGGYRDLLVAAFDSGNVNLTPEYAASMLEFLNNQAGEATGDAQATTDLLRTYLAAKGLQALEPSPAIDTNAFVVTAETAQEYGLATLSDLARVVNGN